MQTKTRLTHLTRLQKMLLARIYNEYAATATPAQIKEWGFSQSTVFSLQRHGLIGYSLRDKAYQVDMSIHALDTAAAALRWFKREFPQTTEEAAPAEIPLEQPAVASGKVVKLDDGRIGVVDCVRPSPMLGANGKPEQIDRAYVIGASNEFADWVVLNQIVKVYGAASAAVATATLA